MEECLTQMQKFNKWVEGIPSFKPGDVVILKQKNTPTAYRPLARITKTFPDKKDTKEQVTR